MSIEIGYAWCTPSGIVDGAIEGGTALTGGPCSRRRLRDLAGPNDTIAIFADPTTWEAIAAVFAAFMATKFAGGFFEEAGKDVWKQRAQLLSNFKDAATYPFRQLVGALTHMKSRPGSSATVLVSTAVSDDGIGFDIPSSDSNDAARRLLIMAHQATAIQRQAEGTYNSDDAICFERNPDMRSLRATLNEDGSVTIPYAVRRRPTAAGEAISPSDRYEHRTVTIPPPSP